MAREEDRVWYAAIRRLGLPPADGPLSAREAREEFRGSPEEPPPDRHCRPDRKKKEKNMHAASAPSVLSLVTPAAPSRRARTHRRPAAAGMPTSLRVAAAALLVGLIAGAFQLWPRSSDPVGKGPGGERLAAAAPLVADEPNEPVADDPTTAETIVGTGEDGTKEGGEERAPYDEETAAKMKAKAKKKAATRMTMLPPIAPLAGGAFRIGEEEFSRDDAVVRFGHLESPYHTSGDHVTLYTTNGVDFGERMLVTAESAYRKAHQIFGKAPTTDQGGALHVFVVRDTEQYNELGGRFGGDEKSSAFYAFATPWLAQTEYGEMDMELPFDLLTVTQFSQAESLTEIYVTHATVEQFVWRLIGPEAADPAPRWFVDGVACYVGRWQKSNLAPWSRDRLMQIGGAPKMKSFLRGYTPNEQNILSAGALVRFMKSDACPEPVREAFGKAIVSVNDGRKVSKTFRKLEKTLAAHDDAFKDSLTR